MATADPVGLPLHVALLKKHHDVAEAVIEAEACASFVVPVTAPVPPADALLPPDSDEPLSPLRGGRFGLPWSLAG